MTSGLPETASLGTSVAESQRDGYFAVQIKIASLVCHNVSNRSLIIPKYSQPQQNKVHLDVLPLYNQASSDCCSATVLRHQGQHQLSLIMQLDDKNQTSISIPKSA
jgi:hypothetical protein